MPSLSPKFPDKAGARKHARQVWGDFLANRGGAGKLLERLDEFLRQATGDPSQSIRLLTSIPLADEPDHRGLWENFPGRVYLPVVEGPSRMEFRLYLDRGRKRSDLEPGPFGLSQPAGGKNLELPLEAHDIVLVPGLAAGPDGVRLGRGGGFYDRWRDRLQDAMLCAVLPEALCGLDFPGEPHDLRLNRVVTESGLVDY